MDIQIEKLDSESTVKQSEVTEYSERLLDNGINTTEGNRDYIWLKFEGFSAVRFPEFNVIQPDKEEIKRTFKALKCLVVNYTIIPQDKNLVNATLYNCTDNGYNIEKLKKNARRDIRIAQRNLRFGFAEWEEILNNGLKAFSDTRNRVGLSDGNEKSFKKRFTEFSGNPFHRPAAAWLENKIAAFMSLIIVDDFVIIQGSFSTDEHKKYCPNNGLVDFILNHFLVKEKFSNVCYGLSSIQENTGKEGLHAYKIRVGFEAIPVQRVFILHPMVAPFKKVLRKVLHIILFIFPMNRTIRKASGILET